MPFETIEADQTFKTLRSSIKIENLKSVMPGDFSTQRDSNISNQTVIKGEDVLAMKMLKSESRKEAKEEEKKDDEFCSPQELRIRTFQEQSRITDF